MIDPQAIRRQIVSMCYHSNMGHLGCSLSVVEILAAIYETVDVEAIKRGDPDRDRVVFSKGHCAPATYATLAEAGIIERAALDGYATDGSVLAGLVSHACPGVELSTGAVGHGITVAVGCALGMKRKGYAGKVYCLVGDSELQEGSVWEAMWLAAYHRLSNLVVLVDDNQIGSVTQTRNVADAPRILNALRALGCGMDTVDGHDVDDIRNALRGNRWGYRPQIVHCQTVKGYGVSFMSGVPVWHYKSLTDKTYAQAMAELA